MHLSSVANINIIAVGISLVKKYMQLALRLQESNFE